MASESFQCGDLVWAKMKTYPPWPAKIADPKSDSKAPKQKKSHFVYFFGTNNYAWIPDENITMHNETILNNLIKKRSSAYQNAITAFLDYSAKQSPQRNKQVPSSEESVNLESSQENNVPDVDKEKPEKVVEEKPKKRKLLPKKKKRTLEEGISKKCSVPKQMKLESAQDPLVGSVPPSDVSFLSMRGSSSQEVYDSFISAHDLGKSNDCLQEKHVSASPKKFGFIGLGHIGRSIVLNLLNSGHDVTVWNRTAYKSESFLHLRAKIASSPAELIVSCDITFCSVSDPNASKSLIFGERGILKGLELAEKQGKTDRGYVEMTSIDPETSEQIAEAILRKKGRYLEAPIFGDSKNSLEGTLLILASGDRRVFKDCETCFHAIGKHAYYIDCKLGFGTKLSLVLSTFSGTMYAALAEAVALTQRMNLDINFLLQILEKGPLRCSDLLEKVQMMVKCNFRTVTPLKHMQKDMQLSLLMADQVFQPMNVTAGANELYKHARLLKYSNCDVSAVYQAARY